MKCFRFSCIYKSARKQVVKSALTMNLASRVRASKSDLIELESEGTPDLAESLLNRVNQRAKENLREDSDADSLLKGVGTSPPGNNKPSPLAANVTESNPIVLKPQGGPERHKTLKCLECGTMNYPTEWYCERCGAELAAV